MLIIRYKELWSSYFK